MKFTREEEILKPADDSNVEKANWHLKVSGESIRKPGYEYEGTLSCHVYVNKFYDGERSFAVQFIGDMPEKIADIAWKEIRRTLMRRFGRKEIIEDYEKEKQ